MDDSKRKPLHEGYKPSREVVLEKKGYKPKSPEGQSGQGSPVPPKSGGNISKPKK